MKLHTKYQKPGPSTFILEEFFFSYMSLCKESDTWGAAIFDVQTDISRLWANMSRRTISQVAISHRFAAVTSDVLPGPRTSIVHGNCVRETSVV